ncbi:hypothetical protein [Deinococcus aluminii]|uniref:Tyr recombinase domain-containing protein n=1 Tax=Deinococcus aluminii TaxID=1656885 RepID=A0ABP9XFF5_9DEIO
MTPDSPRQHLLRQALSQYDLDQLLGLLREQLSRPEPQTHSNLHPIFKQAQVDELDLLQPPEDFHTWLHAPLRHTRYGPGTAKPNTVIARLSTLRNLYEVLIDEGLLTNNPARDCPAPSAEHKAAPLPSPRQIARLLAEARETDPHLFAALTLIHQHAFQLTELLRLRWSALDFSRGELLRARTVTPLTGESLRALHPLLAQAGGPLHAPEQAERVFPYANDQDFRLELWKLCKQANLPLISPSDLRRASLRDHPQGPAEKGFSNPQAYKDALKYAGQVLRKERT